MEFNCWAWHSMKLWRWVEISRMVKLSPNSCGIEAFMVSLHSGRIIFILSVGHVGVLMKIFTVICLILMFSHLSSHFTNVGISKRVSKFLYLHMILISFHWCFRTFPPTDVRAITYCVTYSAAVNSDILKGSDICFFFIIKELLRYYFYKCSKYTILWNNLLRKML